MGPVLRALESLHNILFIYLFIAVSYCFSDILHWWRQRAAETRLSLSSRATSLLYERREREVTIGTALPSVLTHNSSQQEPANLCHRGREREIPRTGVEDPAEQSGIIGAFAAHRTGKLDCIYLFSIF